MNRAATAFLMILIFTIGSIASASSNQYVDVPAGHWAYEAVTELAKDGIASGYSDRDMQQSKTLTRYAMAQIIANAMTKEDLANAEQKVVIKKLTAEFKDDLDKLGIFKDEPGKSGVRGNISEKKSNTFQMSGYARLRYQQNDGLQGYSSNLGSKKRASRFTNDERLFISGSVNENIIYEGALVARIQTADVGNADKQRNGFLEFYRANITFKNLMPTSDLTIGRQFIRVANGLVFGGDYFDGAKMTFGNRNQLNGFVAYGDYSYMPGPTYPATYELTTTQKTAGVLGIQYDVNKDTTLYAGYVEPANTNAKYRNHTIGFNTQLSDQISLRGDYAKNNYNKGSFANDVTADKTAWFTTIQYGTADRNKPGSKAFWVRYAKIGKDSLDWTAAVTQFNPTFNNINTGVQGVSVGFDYALSKNAVLNLEYDKWRGFSTDTYSATRDYKPFIGIATQFWFK